MNDKKLLEKVKKCFELVSEVESKQREREREDLRFQVPENQWDEEAKKYRQGSDTAPGRPMLSISLLSQPLQLIYNQAANARLGVEIHPVSEKANQDIAEVKQGLYRRIERDSNADLARLWALDRASKCGRGWYRINTQWDEDGDNPFDQEIVIERILDQGSVYMDPAAQKADFSDARWGLLTTWVPVDTFEELYPGKEVPKNATEFRSWTSDDPKWVKADGKDEAVLVVEYFYKEIKQVEVTAGNGKNKRTRNKEDVKVWWCTATARQILEQQEWPGRYIPLVPVIGRELQMYDGERQWEGLTRQARDGQKFANYAASTLVERMAMEPKMPFVGAEGQFDGHEDEWKLANIRNQPYIEYRPTSFQGNLNPPPQRAQIDSSGMSLAMQAFQVGKELVQTSTSVFAPSLGETPNNRESQSGRAILALQQQSDAGTSHYLQNMAKISMPAEAEMILDLMPKVYDRPGRITQILGEENEPKSIMLNRPFVPGQDGRPVPAPPPMPGMVPPQNVKYFDLSQGKYSISVSVGKAFQTRLQEGQQEIGQVLQAQPQLMPIIGPTYFRFRDFPGSKEIADLLKKMRDKQFPGLDQEEGDQPSPEQLKAALEQMQQKMEEMGMQMQAAMKAIETEQVKNQSRERIAEMDNQTKLQIAQQESQVKLALEGIKAELQKLQISAKAQSDAEKTGTTSADKEADRLQTSLDKQADRDHEATMKVVDIATRPPDLTYRGEGKEPLEGTEP